MKSSKEWLSYSNVVATLALFVALGGGAWALSKDSVGSRAIKKDAVRSSEIDNETIKAKDVKPGTVGANEIADGSIGVAELGDGAVGSAELANNAVTALKIANDAITSPKIVGDAITTGKVAGNAITSGKIAAGAVGPQEIANGSINSTEVTDGSLAGGDIAADSLTGAQIAESSLLGVDAASLAGRELVSVVGNTTVVDEVLLTLPALGAELRTDGSPVDDFNIVFENTSNPGKLILACPVGSAGGLSVGGTATGTPAAGEGTMVCYAWDRADPTGPGRTTILCAHDGGASRIICDVLRTP